MRAAALADIHGNLPALEAVLADVERERVDAIVVAGDSIPGPWPAEVFELLSDVGARIVKGNADRLTVEEAEGPLGAWSSERLGPRRLEAVSEWPVTLELDVDGLGGVLVCHSTPMSDETIYTRITPDDEMVDLFAGVDARVVVCGHTHIHYDRSLPNGLRLVNPGSVGMPYEGRRGAFWALLGPDVEFRCTEYDVEQAVAAARAIGAPLEPQLLDYLLDPLEPEAATAEFELLRGA